MTLKERIDWAEERVNKSNMTDRDYWTGYLDGVMNVLQDQNDEAARALSNANEPADRCSTCENNGKPICSSCIMTGHGNDIDFYRAATEPKGEHHD